MQALRIIIIIGSTLLIFSLLTYLVIFNINTIKGNGNIKVENRSVINFKAIKVKGAFEIVLKQSDSVAVAVMADENLLQDISTEIKDNVLEIKTTKMVRNFSSLKVFISFRELNSVEINGAVDLKCEHPVKSDNFEITINGAGKAEINIETDKLDVEINGAGIADMSGSAYVNDIGISGAGVFKGFKLETSKTNIEISGAAKAYVNASNNLEVNISGAAEVEYKGKPALKQNISGAGHIKEVATNN